MLNERLKDITIIETIQIIALALMFASSIYVCYWIITERINSCTSDPVRYAINKLIDNDSSLVFDLNNYSYISISIYQNRYDSSPLKEYKIEIKK